MGASTIYLNGQFISADQARIGVFDGGFLHGAGLFETMRAEQGRLFRVESHLERLRNSAEKLLRPIERAELPSRVDFLELLERNSVSAARVRLTVTAGHMQPATAEPTPWTICATAITLAPPSDQWYQNGAQVSLAGFRVSPSDPIAGHKTTSYLPRLIALREAHQKNCLEALWFTTRNTLAEGCISSVFIISGGILKTPALDTPVLPGIARAAIIHLAREQGLEVLETALSVDDLLDADEVFLTSVIMQVMPVTRVERSDIGSGKPGPWTQKLRAAFQDLVRKECSPE